MAYGLRPTADGYRQVSNDPLFSSPRFTPTGRLVWPATMTTSKRSPAFEVTSKRRKGYPSETRVKRGDRTVHGNKELLPREVGPQ
jgi:hypothetical protein